MYARHEFYCIKCGNRGIDLMRKQGHQHKKFHRKKLYCIHCKTEVNHVECKNAEDVAIFKEQFANGDFIEECQESLDYLKKGNGGN